MTIRPIKTDKDHEAALKEIERLFDAKPGTPEDDLLGVLLTLVHAYEEEHFPIPPPHPIEALKFWMESRGLSRKDLECCIGSRARVAEVLNRKRALTLEMIRRLNKKLGIPADFLIQPYKLAKKAA